eukprot:5423966-Amphidinium_carterae.1
MHSLEGVGLVMSCWRGGSKLRFAVFIAALGHDVGHPGLNNNFFNSQKEAVHTSAQWPQVTLLKCK